MAIRRSAHGIILAKNEPAKRCGVKTAETIWKAKQKCPGLILLPPHHRLYAEYSKKINAVYGEYTDLVEPFGIDESWLDVTNSLHLFGGGRQSARRHAARPHQARIWADDLGRRVVQQRCLPSSAATNKSPMPRPSSHATTARHRLSPARRRPFVWSAAVHRSCWAATACARSANSQNARGNARNPDGQNGSQLYRYANGLDDSPVRGAADREPIKSVGNSTTFRRDLTRWDEVQSGISLLSDSVAMRLRRYGLYCGGVQVGIKNSRFPGLFAPDDA